MFKRVVKVLKDNKELYYLVYCNSQEEFWRELEEVRIKDTFLLSNDRPIGIKEFCKLIKEE